MRHLTRARAPSVTRGILDAAGTFEQDRLPELFCGFERDGAPVPRAWAAATPLLAAQIFLGLTPDAPNRRCNVAPFLPAWLPELTLRGIEIADGRLEIEIARHGDRRAWNTPDTRPWT